MSPVDLGLFGVVIASVVAAPTLADAVADRQEEYLNLYYDAFRNDSGYGTDARVTIDTAYTTFALGKPFADVFDANAKLDQYLTANADIWVGRRGENLALVPSYWELTTLAAMVTDPNLSQQITPTNQTKIKDYLFSFATELGTADRPSVDADKRTRIFESDNHDPHHAVVHWMTAQALKDDPAYANVTFPGGYTPEQRYGQWTTKLLDHFQDRAGRGGTVEVGSTVYTLIYTNTLFQVAEYAEDPRLKEVARTYLDLHYADIAQETVESVRAGAKSRSTKDRSLWSQHERSGVYLYPFVGEPAENLPDLAALDAVPREEHIGALFGGAWTTDYRVPDEIAGLIRDDDARGSYSYVTNRLGQGTIQTLEQEKVYFPTDGQSKLLRTTTVTPKYALGWFTIDENEEYMAISSQAQMMSVVTDATRESRLVFNLSGENKVLSELQAVGHGDAVLIKKQDAAPAGAKPRFYVSNDFDYEVELDGWVFGTDNNGSYFAVKGMNGGAADTFTTSDASADAGGSTTGGNYLTFSNENTVMVVQMGLASDYASFFEFQTAVRNNTLVYDNVEGSLTYDAGMAVKMFDDTRVPHVGGQAVDLTPDKTWDSPYLNGEYGSKVVTVTGLDGATLDLDFHYNPVAPTQHRTAPANTTQTGVYSPGYREMVGVTEFSSDTTDPLVYALDPSAVLQIDFDAFHNVMDTLAVNGELRLGGELLIHTIRDTPTQPGLFQVLDANSLIGSFDTVTLPSLSSGLFWDTDNLAIDGRLAILQARSITFGDTDNTVYATTNPDDNPPIDPAFEADIQSQLNLNGNWTLKGLDEDNRNDIRAMTFTFDSVSAAALDSVWIEARVAGLGGYENDVMVLDFVGNHRRLDAMEGYVEGGGWMMLRYELDASEFVLLEDGQLNLAFFDDTRVDWVTLSWIESAAIALAGDYNGDGFVSQSDLDLVLLDWGATDLPAGFDASALSSGGAFDGLMSQNELDGVLLNWGSGTPPSVNAIPEPNSLAVVGLGGIAILRRQGNCISSDNRKGLCNGNPKICTCIWGARVPYVGDGLTDATHRLKSKPKAKVAV